MARWQCDTALVYFRLWGSAVSNWIFQNFQQLMNKSAKYTFSCVLVIVTQWVGRELDSQLFSIKFSSFLLDLLWIVLHHISIIGMVGYNNITKCVHISINLTIYKSFHRIIKIPQKSFQQAIQESLQGMLKFHLKFLQGWHWLEGCQTIVK